MTNYIYYQTILQFRIPIKDDGTPGNPEVVKKFTSPIKGAQAYNVRKNDPVVKKATKEKEQRELLKSLQTNVAEEEYL